MIVFALIENGSGSGFDLILKGKYMQRIAKLCVKVRSFAGFRHLTPCLWLDMISLVVWMTHGASCTASFQLRIEP